jgi:hypothetical protein
MFIDFAMNHMTRAPAERNVPSMNERNRQRFAPPERGRILRA